MSIVNNKTQFWDLSRAMCHVIDIFVHQSWLTSNMIDVSNVCTNVSEFFALTWLYNHNILTYKNHLNLLKKTLLTSIMVDINNVWAILCVNIFIGCVSNPLYTGTILVYFCNLSPGPEVEVEEVTSLYDQNILAC